MDASPKLSWVWAAGALFTCSAFLSDAASTATVEVLREGEFLDEVPRVSPSNWLALVVDESGAALIPAVVEIVSDGYAVRVRDGSGSVVLLRGENLAGGPLVAALVDAPPVEFEPKTLMLGDIRYTLTLESCDPHYRCEWVLRHGSVRQVIAEINPNGPISSELIWAGDLDRDGKLDLVVVIADQAMTAPTVFLSSLATVDGLVGFAGDFRFGNC